MAKDLTNLKEVLDGQLETIKQYLNQGYTVLVAIEKGTKVKIALQTGYSYLFKANVELKESKADAGTCPCGEPADTLIYMWRE